MLGIFKRSSERVAISENNIFIKNKGKNAGSAVEIEHVFLMREKEPVIMVHEDANLIRTYRIQAIDINPDLNGQFFHCSIRILPNSAVMIDGIISRSKSNHLTWTDKDYEAVRLQPFYLSDKKEENERLVGLGLFMRGLHFSGTVTSTGVRVVCVCDQCNLSFTLQHFHAGFSEVQYFYSDDGKETLTVPYGAVENMPHQLQEIIDHGMLRDVEAALPIPLCGIGKFRYYNPFPCPHCQAPFIDFGKNKDIRPGEYYGNTLVNVQLTHWDGRS
jgi:hypothetical protein